MFVKFEVDGVQYETTRAGFNWGRVYGKDLNLLENDELGCELLAVRREDENPGGSGEKENIRRYLTVDDMKRAILLG